jgi:hypothetical protein
MIGAATLHRVAKQAPAQALFGAVLQLALQDAKDGDSEALEWISSADCLWYAGRLETDGVTAEQIQARLIEHATTEG